MVALETTPFFKELGAEERELLAGICEARRHAKGETLFREGDEAGALHVLVKGLVSFRQRQKHGGEEALMGSVNDPGDVFGIAAVVGDRHLYAHTAVCLEETELVRIDGEKLLALCEENPRAGFHIWLRLTAVLAERLAAAREQIRSRIRPGLISHG